MIGFFRRMRKKLADDNKPMKYMRYAIGEIVLVMIGILLALQVNNWNEKRKSNILAHKFLKQLQLEIVQDTIDLSWNLSIHKQNLNSEKGLLKKLKDKNYNLPDDFSYAYILGVDPLVALQQSTIKSLREEGLTIIQNESLRNMISKLYDFYYQAIVEIENKSMDYTFSDEKLSIVSKNFRLSNKLTKSVTEAEENITGEYALEEIEPINMESLRANEEFKIILSQSIFYRNVHISLYEEMLNRIVEVDIAITNELQNQ